MRKEVHLLGAANKRPQLAPSTHSVSEFQSGRRQKRSRRIRFRSINKESEIETSQSREPWNKGKLIGQKPPLKLKDIWAIRIHLQLGKRIRDLAMFNLAIDSKLRGCDLITSGFAMLPMVTRCYRGRLSFNERRSGLCNLS